MVAEHSDKQRLIKLFTEAREYEESSLRDRKRRLPNLQQREEKAEFIRDVIAMANTARLWGQPAYLLYGIDDNGNLCGVDLSVYSSPSKATDEIKNTMSHIINDYIEPLLAEWDFGLKQLGDTWVAYLEILPPPNPDRHAYQVKKDWPSAGSPQWKVSRGESWLRIGESKTKVDPQTIQNYIWSKTPSLFPKHWQKYFEILLSDNQLQRAWSVQYYDLKDTKDRLLKEIVREFLEGNDRVLIIRGRAGYGKTLFLRRLVKEWVEAGLAAIEGIRQRHEFLLPPTWIPIYFPLRNVRIGNDIASFPKRLLRHANQRTALWRREPPNPEGLFEYFYPFDHEKRALRWLICLDGLDEMETETEQRALISAIQDLKQRYALVKIILTTRTDMTTPDDLGQVVEIAPFPLEVVRNFLISHLASPEQIEKVYNLIITNSDLQTLFSVPMYLEALVNSLSPTPISEPSEQILVATPGVKSSDEAVSDLTFGLYAISSEEVTIKEPIDSEPVGKNPQETSAEESLEQEEPILPPIGWLLARIVRSIWERESERRVLQRDHLCRWKNGLGKLAFRMDGHRSETTIEEAQRDIGGIKGLRWVLSLGILQADQQFSLIRFIVRLMQIYFAALYLGQIRRAGQRIRPPLTEEFQGQVEEMLSQISPEFSGGDR